MDRNSSVTSGLDRVVRRFDVAGPDFSPTLAENALRDVLPADPRAISVLVAVVRGGGITRMVQYEAEDAPAALPEIAADLASRFIHDPVAARWGVLAWGAALGRWPGDLGDLDGAPLPGPAPVPPPEPEPEPEAEPGPGPVPPPGHPSRRTGLWIAIGAAAVVLLLAVVGALAFLRPAGKAAPSAAAERPDAVLTLTAGSTASVTADGGRRVAVDGQRLESGDQLAAENGPVTVRIGRATALRLDSGATVSSGARATAFRLLGGRIWVDSARTPVDIDMAGGSVRVGPGASIIRCAAGNCVVQAIEDVLVVRPTGGAAVRLQRHQAVALGSTAAARVVTTTAPDLLRQDDWITANRGLDRTAGLPAKAISGRSVVGTWTFVFHSARSSTPIERPVRLAVDCAAQAGCRIAATSLYQTCPSKPGSPNHVLSCALTGTAAPDGSDRDAWRITWSAFPVDCEDSSAHVADGTGTATDAVTFAGSGETSTVSGARRAVYTPIAPTACSKQGPSFTTQTIPLTGRAGGGFLTGAAETHRAAAEDLYNHHIGPGSTCRQADPPRAKSSRDLVCTFDGGTDAAGHRRPEKAEYIQFIDHRSDRRPAFVSLTANAPPRLGSNCDTGPCRRPVDDGGAIVAWGGRGTSQLVAYAPKLTASVIHATGGASTGALYRWFTARKDYSLAPLPFFGL